MASAVLALSGSVRPRAAPAWLKPRFEEAARLWFHARPVRIDMIDSPREIAARLAFDRTGPYRGVSFDGRHPRVEVVRFSFGTSTHQVGDGRASKSASAAAVRPASPADATASAPPRRQRISCVSAGLEALYLPLVATGCDRSAPQLLHEKLPPS